MSENEDKQSPSEAQRLQEAKKAIAGDVTDRLKDVADHMDEISKSFASIGATKDAEFYQKQKERIQKMAGWYDPAAKKQAKIDRMKAQLAKLEAEAEAERSGG